MARLSSDLVLTLHDRVTGAAKTIDLSLDKLERRQNALGQGMAGTTGATAKAGSALGLYARSAAAAAAPLAAAFGAKEIVVSAAQFESALTNIQKKAGITGEQTRQLGEDIKELATSGKLASSIDEIASAYERGAAAGIPLDQLKTFATLSAKAADAFEMSASDVGNAAAGFSTVLKIPMKDMERYFDLINGLADSGIADESGIVDYIDRAGSMGKTFGLLPDEIAAFGAALANLKVPAEKAATATNSIFANLLAPGALSKDARKAFSKVIKDEDKFGKQLANGESAQAFVGMLESLKAMNNEARAGYVVDLFGKEHADTVLQMVEGIDEVKKNLRFATGTDWFGSLEKSYQLKLDDMQSQWQLFQNNLKKLTIDLGTLILPPGKDFLRDAGAAVKGFGDTIDGVKASYDLLSSALSGQVKTPGGFNPKSWTDDLWGSWNRDRQEATAHAAETEKALAEKDPKSGAVGAQAARNVDDMTWALANAGMRNSIRKLSGDTPGEKADRQQFIEKQQPAEQYDPGSGESYRDWLVKKRAREQAAEAAKPRPAALPPEYEWGHKTGEIPAPRFRPQPATAQAPAPTSVPAPAASVAGTQAPPISARSAEQASMAALDALQAKAAEAAAAMRTSLGITVAPGVDVTGINNAISQVQTLASALRNIPGLAATASTAAGSAASQSSKLNFDGLQADTTHPGF